uniref:Uncharacterized protein n=1 Tax=Rangifer tarandus platyrhynchus TaxID=3082113 RepID=A0ACB0EYU9_RANTA|nr:unnamed protein product [Rangifer tarandus platyrhynchus]
MIPLNQEDHLKKQNCVFLGNLRHCCYVQLVLSRLDLEASRGRFVPIRSAVVFESLQKAKEVEKPVSQGSKVAGGEIPRALSSQNRQGWLWIRARFLDVQRHSLLGCPRGALNRAVVQGQAGTKRPLLWHLDTGAQQKAQEDGVGGGGCDRRSQD